MARKASPKAIRRRAKTTSPKRRKSTSPKRRRSPKKTKRSRSASPSGKYSKGQLFGALRKAWIGYKIALSKGNKAKQDKYASIIQQLQGDLGLPQTAQFKKIGSAFPGSKLVCRKARKGRKRKSPKKRRSPKKAKKTVRKRKTRRSPKKAKKTAGKRKVRRRRRSPKKVKKTAGKRKVRKSPVAKRRRKVRKGRKSPVARRRARGWTYTMK